MSDQSQGVRLSVSAVLRVLKPGSSYLYFLARAGFIHGRHLREVGLLILRRKRRFLLMKLC